MFSHPGASLSTIVAGEVVGDDEDVAGRMIGFDVGKQGNVVGRVARSGTPGHLLAIAHTQRAIHPGFLRTTAVIQRRFDAVPRGRPAGCGEKGAGDYWPQFVGA